MGINREYAETEPARAAVDALEGPVLIEFGAPWCAHCRAVQPWLAEALDGFPAIRHVKIEDGPGRRLGRSFHVKLWPTLVLLKQGVETGRLVRPADEKQIRSLLLQSIE